MISYDWEGEAIERGKEIDHLRAELATAEAQRDSAQMTRSIALDKLAEAEQSEMRVKAQQDALAGHIRTLIKEVGIHYTVGTTMYERCLWCKKDIFHKDFDKPESHRDNCPRQAALAALPSPDEAGTEEKRGLPLGKKQAQD